MQPSALFFVYVWPEPVSSAAGVRTRELMRALREKGWKITAASPSAKGRFSEELGDSGIETVSVDPNLTESTEKSLSALSPALVVYDRFVMEEQFGWRARALFPNALHLVDTQDLHCLRRARERLSSAGEPWERILSPTTHELGEDLLRELGSLYRCDAALVVSSAEHALLCRLGFPGENLLHLAFPAEIDDKIPPFGERSGFCFLGNFRHPPNLDCVRFTLKEIWPSIRSRLPQAELHLYGSYPPGEISAHKGRNGVFAHGPVELHRDHLRKHRALLSPLRFGAGIKGKVLESWGTGTPVLGTPLTFEGMGTEGLVERDPETLAGAAVALHEEEMLWKKQSALGLAAVKENFNREGLAEIFLRFIDEKLASLDKGRAANLTGAMLRHHGANSTKYFSRWIEAKNAASKPKAGGA
jgi:glycosyltransferase involved in cell wall biosynthesis